MHPFHGNLLIGGMALKDLDGVIDEDAGEELPHWSGSFTLDRSQTPLLQIGRPYRLILDDGRAGQVVVSRIGCHGDDAACQVDFSGTSHLQ